MNTIDPTRIDPRTLWRMTQIVARILDAQYPWWFKDEGMVYVYLHACAPLHARCWEQHIRQRLGD